ncbi:MAG: endonuclease [Elusimicrobia bacterium]|nr:endonuclease [Elusimicrobiota bacterium]
MTIRRRASGTILPLLLAASLHAAPNDSPALESLRRLVPDAAVVRVPVFQPAAVESPAGAQLLASLHELTGRGYREHGYQEASHYLFSTADNVARDGRRGVADAYSGVFVPGTGEEGGDYREAGDQNGDDFVDGQGMNVEHTWPQSFFSKRLPMKSDLHHLLATFIHPNSVRGSLPFGEVRGAGEYHNNGGAKAGQGVFEPPDAAKGRVARAVLYFYTRYHDRNITNGGFGPDFWNRKLELILRWNRRFPPDQDEKRRNDLVERFQGNRNPYVDDPALADRIGVDGFQRASRWDGLAR